MSSSHVYLWQVGQNGGRWAAPRGLTPERGKDTEDEEETLMNALQ